MSDRLKTYNFLQQLEQGYIRIPRIQRGYAQGRQAKKVDEIRRTFLHTLFQVIRGKRESTELDFVYGSMNSGAFEPLDGQQRLTTLFLIHWMLGVNLIRKDDEKHSVFTYASCPTSEDFSNALVTHDAIALINETLGKRGQAKSENDKECTPSQLIIKRDWFHWEWKFDPSINSMLVMIDSIFAEIISDARWNENLADYRSNLNRITFNGLNLGDFGLSNELFIKMNARGKQLSDFDKVKSTLEEEIQIQESESDCDSKPIATLDDETNWRTLMDGKWSDYFWHTYARKTIFDSKEMEKEDRKRICLEAAKNCERQFKIFLLRMIQLQLHAKMPVSDELREACYKRNGSEIDNLLMAYSDSLLAARNSEFHVVKPSETLIDFASLINTVNALLTVSEDGTVSDIFQQLPEDTHINSNDITLMQSFLEDSVPNDVALTFFASLQFINSFPFKNDGVWKANFSRWIKSLRNTLSNNNNTQRIDKLWRYENAMNAIMEMSRDLAAFGNDNKTGPNDKNFVNSFFYSINDKTYVGIDNQSLNEETKKARLVLSDSRWEGMIDAAERDSYLWGQIRALIEWAADDMEAFKTYSEKLTELLEFIRRDSNKYYIASLKLDSDSWKASNRLYQLNYDRDNSFKRYLRDYDKSSGTNAPLIKRMIDRWINSNKDLSAGEFIESIINDEDIVSPAWIDCIIAEPAILDNCYLKRLYEDRGHVILAQLKTKDSHCIDPILKYLQLSAIKKINESRISFDDSKGTPPHSLSLNTESNAYTVQWSGHDTMYSLTDPEGQTQELDAKELIEMFANIIDSQPQ